MRVFMLVQAQESIGPTPRIAAQLVVALRELGCTVFTHGWGGTGRSERVATKLIRRSIEVLSASRAVRRHSADVVVVHTAHDWNTLLRDIAVTLAIRRRSRPVVLHMHGSQPDRLVRSGDRAFKLATRLLTKAADAIFVLSGEEQRQWSAFTSRIPVLVVRNPYVRSFAATSESRRTDRSPPYVLFVGRLLAEKGIFDLVDALPLVRARTPCLLVFAGEGERASDLEARIARLGLDDAVTMTGQLAPDALRDEYARAEVFALPTRWPEGFPTVLSEAMDAGLPIVTTAIRGAADHLVAGEHALFVAPGDVSGLADALVTLLEDPGLRERMGSANRRKLASFEPSAVASDYVKALTSVVSSAQGLPSSAGS